ncbi:MAG TPA: hypothetical protein VGX45_17370 [Solirubrobacteraceae bacterium]|nr:hypothetical protein [Solirubrobacteraceae bacterium]
MHQLLGTIVQPPVNFKASSFQNVFSIAQIVVFAVMVAFALRELARGKGPIFISCLIGGAIAVIWEPIVDVLGQCWLPSRGQHWEAFTLIGRHIPLMMPFVYSWFVGGQGYLFYRIFDRGIDRRRLFQLYGLVMLVNVALESPGVLTNVYTYYGKQPMDIWGLPLWWVIINPLMPMIAGAAIYKLKPLLTTPQLIVAVIAIIPCADGAANAIVGWPVIAALNTNVGYAGTWVASFITLGLGLSVAWLMSLLVARPSVAVATAPATVPAVQPSMPIAAGV